MRSTHKYCNLVASRNFCRVLVPLLELARTFSDVSETGNTQGVVQMAFVVFSVGHCSFRFSYALFPKVTDRSSQEIFIYSLCYHQ